MVRSNVSLNIELVFVDEDEGCDLRVSFIFSVESKSENFISSLIEAPVGNNMIELDVKSCSQLLTVETLKVMFIVHF